jgi:hypothetical protein
LGSSWLASLFTVSGGGGGGDSANHHHQGVAAPTIFLHCSAGCS